MSLVDENAKVVVMHVKTSHCMCKYIHACQHVRLHSSLHVHVCGVGSQELDEGKHNHFADTMFFSSSCERPVRGSAHGD